MPKRPLNKGEINACMDLGQYFMDHHDDLTPAVKVAITLFMSIIQDDPDKLLDLMEEFGNKSPADVLKVTADLVAERLHSRSGADQIEGVLGELLKSIFEDNADN